MSADGSLDGGFEVALESELEDGPIPVWALALQGDGQILVAGEFDRVQGLPRFGLARLNGCVFRFEFHSVERLASGRVRLRFAMPRGQSHLLQASGDFLKASTLSAKQKQRFRQMEWKSNALDLDEYRDILRRVLAPGLHDMTPESRANVTSLHDELREFFKRYEILSWQVVPSRATNQHVL